MLLRSFIALLLAAAAAPAAVDFAAEIEPIFHQRCYMCHSSAQQMSGLRLDSREAAIAGGEAGPAIVPGDSAASALIERLTSEKSGFKMPPVGGSLSGGEIALVARWIDEGAVWAEREPGHEPSAQERITHWSFRPVEQPEPPAVKKDSWIRNPVDRFILAKLEQEGVEPSPEADKVTLLRRAYFDLTGLPPSPEETARFLADGRPDAYERLVDDLMRSPHYGERRAMGWLDAARYADSDGYERDPLRPHAWRWRHWVIDAMNRDMPFDRFTVEQIAGDLLPNATVEQRVATGFMRNGIKNREAGVMNEEKRFEEVLDRINATGTVWLGLTVGCAQCHDHKYDPISQKEFFQLFAFLDNAVERDIEAPLHHETGPYLWAWPRFQEQRAEVIQKYGIPELADRWREKIIEAMDNPGVNTDWDFHTTEWRAANDRPDWKMRSYPDGLTQIERDEVIDWFIGRPGPEVEKNEGWKERVEAARKEIGELRKDLPELTRAYTMIERDEAHSTRIALRGDWRSPGGAVEPGTPAVLPSPAGELQSKPARLLFAEWLVSQDNPLTPRVTVNRLWNEFFGEGLVRTADDFGLQGEKPSHSGLLDWLAAEFRGNGWSQKHIVRLIVTSAAYRQSSAARPELSERDPDNRWLARQNRLRLPAEIVRDNALTVSGLLNPEIGGRSVRPPQPEGVDDLSYSRRPWVADTGPNRYRRGLYIFFRRTSPYPMLINFDAPSSLVSSVKRERSNTPLQSLNLLNDPVFQEAAQALALRAVNEAKGFNERLERIFRLALSRPPEPGEKDRIATYFERQKRIFESEKGSAEKIAPFVPPGVDRLELAAWTGAARGLLNLDEFIVRE